MSLVQHSDELEDPVMGFMLCRVNYICFRPDYLYVAPYKYIRDVAHKKLFNTKLKPGYSLWDLLCDKLGDKYKYNCIFYNGVGDYSVFGVCKPPAEEILDKGSALHRIMGKDSTNTIKYSPIISWNEFKEFIKNSEDEYDRNDHK